MKNTVERLTPKSPSIQTDMPPSGSDHTTLCRLCIKGSYIWTLKSSVCERNDTFAETCTFYAKPESRGGSFRPIEHVIFVLYIWISSFRTFSCFSQNWRLLDMFYRCCFIVICLCLICKTTNAQSTDADCDANSDCHPMSVDLLNERFTTRNLTVSSTCGENENDIYRRISTELVDTNFVCNTTFPGPKGNMIDFHTQSLPIFNVSFENPQLSTYWQTQTTIATIGVQPREEYIIFHMQDQFLVRVMEIIFISPHTNLDNSDMRPKAMVLERKETTNSDWQAWRYYAENCETSFPDIPIQADTGVEYDATTAVCKESFYAGDTSTHTGYTGGVQLVTFNPALDYNSEYESVYEAQKRYLASAVRVRLVQPADDVPLSSYYAVADFEISGQCACFGHAATCQGDNEAVCHCQHNTQGVNCEECLPLKNNLPWRMGHGGQANPCEDCGCNDHADLCHYDVTKGYGVCDNCVYPTTGDKCEWCTDNYYVNPTITQNVTIDDPNADCAGFNGTDVITYTCGDGCIPCNCSTDGSVRDIYTCDNSTGQCVCKEHVTGRACDECIDTYWNLDFANELGCIECDCHLAGTVNNTNMCDKVTGQCMCKDNTNGTRCDVCKTDTFLLEESNPDGCTLCDCDPGGSVTSSCHDVTGSCSCRDNINARRCNTATEGYFVPRFDYLILEAEFLPIATIDNVVEEAGEGDVASNVTGRGFLRVAAAASVQFTYSVPKTFNYDVIIRYRTDSEWSNMLVLTIGDSSELVDTSYECAGQIRDVTEQLNLQATLPATEKGGVVVGQVCLKDGIEYTSTLEIPQPTGPGAQLLIDSLVLLPVYADITATSRFDAQSLVTMDTCYDATLVVDHVTRSNQSCYLYEFSLMADFLNGSLPCECNVTGSEGGQCLAEGGQCVCKSHVIFQDCSQCEVDHYNFDSGIGCTPCNCHAPGSIHTACNESGICECQPNVIGEKCDSCIAQHYGLASGQGCVECTCTAEYSLNNSCLDDGHCHCKPGVGGVNCDQCADGFHTLTLDGCTSCECDVHGSTEGLCTTDTGLCTCKNNVEGDTCDQCKAGFFGLGSWDADGCLQCQCSGHSSTCSSASNWTQVIYADTWDLLSESAIQDKWGGISSTGDAIEVQTLLDFENNPQYVLQLVNDATNEQYVQYYFVATEHYLGNKRGAYGQSLVVTLSYEVALSENETLEYLTADSGDLIIRGDYADFTMVTALPEYPIATETRYEFTLREDGWTRDSLNGDAITYAEYMQVLSSIQYIWLRAKFSNVSGAVTSMHFAQMGFAQEGNSTTDVTDVIGPINNMEQCVCPPEYTGQFCEQCAAGYTRATPGSGAYSTCIPCACNNHAMLENVCNSDTGECTCTHSTTGAQCQLCLPGFYGDATVGAPDDCKPCLCPGNVIAGAVNVFSSQCELLGNADHRCSSCSEGHGGNHCDVCLQDYYGTPEDPQNNGGVCTPCECNGRADTCNSTTGYCIDCIDNTAGMQCEICVSGYFGNAMIEQCADCNCTSITGSTGGCDDRTGVCECHPNVIGSRCDSCDIDTYNYASGEGCFDCACHPTGALSTTCDVITGDCQCKTHVIGRACDACEDTYWNINSVGCDPCECTTQGTAVNTGDTFGTCDLDTGQCACALPGIIGSTCDHCAAGTPGVDYTYVAAVFIGEYPTCELCGECYDNWAAKIDSLGIDLRILHNDIMQIWSHYEFSVAAEVQVELQQIDDSLQSVQSSISLATDLLQQLDYLSDGFQEVDNDVGNYSVRLDAISATLEQTISDINSLQQDDGNIQIGDTVTSAEMIENATLALMSYYENLTRLGLEAWESIQTLTLLITQANGDVQVLRDRVTVAMAILDVAIATRQTTDNMINGPFGTEYTTNSERLIDLQTTANDFMTVQRDIDNGIMRVQANLDGANATAQTTIEQAVAKLEQTSADVTRAQVLRLNATQTESLVQTANSVARQYKDIATDVKHNMTRAFETVVTYTELTNQMHRDMDQVYSMSSEIASTALRSVQDIREITAQINATQFSDAAVAATNTKADVALARAEHAQNITQTAAESSQVALDELTQVQNNLLVAQQQRTTTMATIDNIENVSRNIQSQISNINQKTTEARELGDNAILTLDNLVIFRQNVAQCFSDVSTRIDGADVQITSQANDITAASLIRTSNAQLLDSANNIIAQKSAGIDASFNDIVSLNNEMTTLRQSLADVEAITSLRVLQNEYTTLVNEMNVMEADLAGLETTIDQLLTSLDLLDPATARCTRS